MQVVTLLLSDTAQPILKPHLKTNAALSQNSAHLGDAGLKVFFFFKLGKKIYCHPLK